MINSSAAASVWAVIERKFQVLRSQKVVHSPRCLYCGILNAFCKHHGQVHMFPNKNFPSRVVHWQSDTSILVTPETTTKVIQRHVLE